MSEEPPPWARPREDTDRLFASRRVHGEEQTRQRPAPPPAAPRPAPRQPAERNEPAEPNERVEPAVRRDPHVGLITGPVDVTEVAADHRPDIGVVAVVMSAVIAAAALIATALAGRAGVLPLVAGSAVPVVAVVAVVVANRFAVRRGLASQCRFVVRAETGESVTWTMTGAAPTGVLRTGDLVRVVPGSGRWARTVDVLAGPDGPVIRRLTGRTGPVPVQWIGVAVAAALLVFTTAVLFGAL
jgi:hypothetical protein